MQTFKQYLKENITIENATDLSNLFSFIRKINSDTLVIDNPNKYLKTFIDKLVLWGYKYSKNGNDTIMKKDNSNIGISINDGATKATIIIW